MLKAKRAEKINKINSTPSIYDTKLISNLKRLKPISKLSKNVKLNEKVKEIKEMFNYDFKIVKGALYGSIQRAQLLPNKYNKYSYEKYLNDSKPLAYHYFKNQLTKLRGIKFNITYKGRFVRTIQGGFSDVNVYKDAVFASNSLTITNIHKIDEQYNNSCESIKTSIEEFIENGSGWRFEYNIDLSIHRYKYIPLAGSSYIELPLCIKNTQAVINIKNDDNKCFLYCISAFDHPIDGKDHPNRPNKYDISKYKTTGLTFPLQIKDIENFEKLNDKSINVYGYELKYNSNTKKYTPEYYPIQLSSNLFQMIHHINNNE